MKKILFISNIVIVLTLSINVKSQDFPNYNLYMQNPFLYNPAYAMDSCKLNAYLNSHLQWIGFDGAPRVNNVGIRGTITPNMGVGLSIFNFKQGITNSTDISLSYGYKVNIANKHYATFGMAAGFLIDNIGDMTLSNINDALANENNFKQATFAAKFGLSYVYNGIEAQIAIPQLYQRKASNLYTVGILSYNYELNPTIDLKPSVLVRGSKVTPKQSDISLTATYAKLVWAQLGYRTNNSLILGIGGNYMNYSFGYAYQMETNNISNAGGGTHEIQLMARFGCNKNTGVGALDYPVDVITVKATVINKDTQTPIDAKVVIIDKEGKEVFNKNVNGSFSVSLIPGKYTAHCEAKNTIPKNENFSVSKHDNEVKLNIELNSLVANKTFALGDVNFETGKSTFKGNESYKVLDELVKIMTDNPLIKIEIGGHTDDVGNDATNTKLSQDRANVCVEYAKSKGIAASRLKAVGYGKSKPLVTNNSDENRAKNRRVDFKILE